LRRFYFAIWKEDSCLGSLEIEDLYNTFKGKIDAKNEEILQILAHILKTITPVLSSYNIEGEDED